MTEEEWKNRYKELSNSYEEMMYKYNKLGEFFGKTSKEIEELKKENEQLKQQIKKMQSDDMDSIKLMPLSETTIERAVFINQDIILSVDRVSSMPIDLSKTVKFLFGEGACVTEDRFNGYPCILIKNASYILRNVCTIDADWTTKIKEYKL